jgi:hypothetical protein
VGRFTGIKQPERIEMAREFLRDLSDTELQACTSWRLMDCWQIYRPEAAEQIILAEQLRRGLVSLNELRPDMRRLMVEAENLDLHAIASGPIMDPANIYCPLGKLSMAEAKEREAQQVCRG